MSWSECARRAEKETPTRYGPAGSARLQVTPKQAEVYTRPYGDIFGPPRASQTMDPSFRTTRDVRVGQPLTAGTPVRVGDTYLVAEPQVNAVWTAAPGMRLDAGVTYRFIGASERLGHELRGPAGTVAAIRALSLRRRGRSCAHSEHGRKWRHTRHVAAEVAGTGTGPAPGGGEGLGRAVPA